MAFSCDGPDAVVIAFLGRRDADWRGPRYLLDAISRMVRESWGRPEPPKEADDRLPADYAQLILAWIDATIKNDLIAARNKLLLPLGAGGTFPQALSPAHSRESFGKGIRRILQGYMDEWHAKLIESSAQLHAELCGTNETVFNELGERVSDPEPLGTQKDPGPRLIARRAIVRHNPEAKYIDICRLWDQAGIPFRDEFEDERDEDLTWERAYKMPKYKHRIEQAITRDRKKVAN